MTLTKEWAETVGPVIRWAKKEGWHRREHLLHDGDGNQLGFDIDCQRGQGRSYYGLRALPVKWFSPDSPQQAIDVLAALGVIPGRFSSQWQAGRDYALTAAAVLLPDLEPVPEFVDGYHVGSRA